MKRQTGIKKDALGSALSRANSIRSCRGFVSISYPKCEGSAPVARTVTLFLWLGMENGSFRHSRMPSAY